MTGPSPLSADERDAVDAQLADLRAIGGEALVARILGSFEQHLAQAEQGGAEIWTAAFAHRTAGLAGMMGFIRLASACRAVEEGPASSPELQARAASAAADACAEVRRRLGGGS